MEALKEGRRKKRRKTDEQEEQLLDTEGKENEVYGMNLQLGRRENREGQYEIDRVT